MTAVVVDIECMNKNIVKEIGIYHTGYCIGIALLPPEEKAKLSDSDRKQNSWLTRHFHYMSWDDGKVKYSSLPHLVDVYGPLSTNSIQRLRVPSDENEVRDDESTGEVEYFAKGDIKCKILKEIFGLNFINLEEFGCPLFSKLSANGGTCRNFGYRHQQSTHCAEKKARAFGVWTTNFFLE